MFSTSLSRFGQRAWRVTARRRPYPRRPACRLWLERLEERTLLNGQPALNTALPISTNKTQPRITFLTNMYLPKKTGRGRFDHPAQYVNYALPLRKGQFPSAASVRRGIE